MIEVKFLFDNQLIADLENLIRNSKHKLLLISPFIDLDSRIRDALSEKLSMHDFELKVLFGKNENSVYKSIKKDSFDFLKQFPNIEIRYNERLHAKFYLNDFDFIMTSLNLYDYSLAKNIEVGITCNYASKGFLGKMLNGTDEILTQGVDKLRQDVLGMNKELNPIEKFRIIFEGSILKYKAEPILGDKSGLKGLVGGKKLIGIDVKEDYLTDIFIESKLPRVEISSSVAEEITALKVSNHKPNSGKLQSASQLSRTLGISQNVILDLMRKSGLINADQITDLGLSKGLLMKNYMGKDYIAYPENLSELKELS